MPLFKFWKRSVPEEPIVLPPVSGFAGWFRNLDKIQHLREVMRDPVVLEAMAILMERERINTSTKSDPDTHSYKLGRVAGYNDAFADLRSVLTTPPSNSTKEEMLDADVPWGHIDTPTGIFARSVDPDNT